MKLLIKKKIENNNRMKKTSIHFNPLFIIGIGMLIVIIGALAKIMKQDFGNALLLIGMTLELLGIIYAVRFYKSQKQKKDQ